jgi:hypothetical protein
MTPTKHKHISGRSDMKPFATGDMLVAATLLNDPEDDHAGDGRIIQFDGNLQRKGELWIDETERLIMGLRFDPRGVLWGFEGHNIIKVSPEGRLLEVRNFDSRTFSNVCFLRDGTFTLGEHLHETELPKGAFTTKLRRRPDGRLGDGHAYRYDRSGRLLDTYQTRITASMGKVLAVTCSVLSPDETRLIYLTETGNKVMQYDLVKRRQLDDLLVLEGPDPMQNMVFWLAWTPDQRLLVCRGDHVRVMDDLTGELRERIELGPFGFAAIHASADNRHLYGGNFLSGDIVKVDMDTGRTVARTNVGVQRSTAGIAEYTGAVGDYYGHQSEDHAA